MMLLIYFLLFLIFYTYLGYFVLTLFLSAFINKKVRHNEDLPTVCLMIAAYNEEKGIAEKIENSLLLNYPKDKLEIVVVSDGSTDKTDEIVSSYALKGIKLIRVEGRVGKTQARNIALRQITSEIILFSDATTEYNENVVQKLVRNFADKNIGMVTGHLIYKDPNNSQMGFGQKLYWQYETMIKKAQTKLGTLTGSIGCITAFRRSAFTELPANIIEDFTEPLMFILKGFRIVYEPEAICYELTTKKSSQEWQMRVRVIRGGLAGLLFAKKILNPIKFTAASFQLFSHKVFRWFIPLFAIILLVVSFVQVYIDPNNTTGILILLLQLLYYIIVLLAYTLEHIGIHSKILGIPYYLFIVNAASLVAIYKTLTQNLESTWETQREN